MILANACRHHMERDQHQGSEDHHAQGAHQQHPRLNRGHHRKQVQHRLGWLHLLCLQDIFQLLPEALGHPSSLPHQDPLGLLSPYIQQQHLFHLHPFCLQLQFPYPQPHVNIADPHQECSYTINILYMHTIQIFHLF